MMMWAIGVKLVKCECLKRIKFESSPISFSPNSILNEKWNLVKQNWRTTLKCNLKKDKRFYSHNKLMTKELNLINTAHKRWMRWSYEDHDQHRKDMRWNWINSPVAGLKTSERLLRGQLHSRFLDQSSSTLNPKWRDKRNNWLSSSRGHHTNWNTFSTHARTHP